MPHSKDDACLLVVFPFLSPFLSLSAVSAEKTHDHIKGLQRPNETADGPTADGLITNALDTLQNKPAWVRERQAQTTEGEGEGRGDREPVL